MVKFIITSIESGKILAREKNPYPESSPFVVSRQEAEVSLKTYPLSAAKKLCIMGAVYNTPDTTLIGQEIFGEVVNGEIVIK